MGGKIKNVKLKSWNSSQNDEIKINCNGNIIFIYYVIKIPLEGIFIIILFFGTLIYQRVKKYNDSSFKKFLIETYQLNEILV